MNDDYGKSSLILKDTGLGVEIRRDLQHPRDYILHLPKSNRDIYLSKGSLIEIIEGNVPSGRDLIEALLDVQGGSKEILKNEKGITLDTIIALITKVHLLEERKSGNSLFAPYS